MTNINFKYFYFLKTKFGSIFFESQKAIFIEVFKLNRPIYVLIKDII